MRLKSRTRVPKSFPTRRAEVEKCGYFVGTLAPTLWGSPAEPPPESWAPPHTGGQFGDSTQKSPRYTLREGHTGS